jgi:hypothetical protein
MTSGLDCLQLKINYSVHQDLNVKGNNERSWDYTNQAAAAPPPLVPPAYAMQNGMGGHYVPPLPQHTGVNDNGEIIVTGGSTRMPQGNP